MFVIFWVFIGVEGVVVLFGRVKNSWDVGKVIVLGFILVMFIYILIFVLLMGVMIRGEFFVLEILFMGYVLEYVVGLWGVVVINIGLVVLFVGILIGWFLFVFEIFYVVGKDGVFLKVFMKINKK